MTQRNRERQSRARSDRDRTNRQQNEDWAREVQWDHWEGPYRDYGWEDDQSALPQFRDPSIHFQPYEREQINRWRETRWNEKYNYGEVEDYGPYTGVGPKGYQRSDERIFEEVCERLTRHGQIDASNMQVHVDDGEVTLEGAVDSRQTKRMAEDAIDRVRGVKDVHNRLHIQKGNQQNRSGNPGGGKGRVDRVGNSGVYPASGPLPEGKAEAQGMASWGQGERGAEGYEDSGRSELHIPDEERKNKPTKK